MKTPLQFLQETCGIKTESDSVNYKYYEGSNVVNTIPVKEAIEMLNNDIKETIDFTLSYGLTEEKATEATYKIWEKHLVVFK